MLPISKINCSKIEENYTRNISDNFNLKFYIENENQDLDQDKNIILNIDFENWEITDFKSLENLINSNLKIFNELIHDDLKKNYSLEQFSNITLSIEKIRLSLCKQVEHLKQLDQNLWLKWNKHIDDIIEKEGNLLKDDKKDNLNFNCENTKSFLFCTFILPYYENEEILNKNLIHLCWNYIFFGPLFGLWFIQNESPIEIFFSDERLMHLLLISKDLSPKAKEFFGILFFIINSNSTLYPC